MSNQNILTQDQLEGIAEYIESVFDEPDRWYPRILVQYSNKNEIILSIRQLDNGYYVNSHKPVQDLHQFDITWMDERGFKFYTRDFSEESDSSLIRHREETTPDTFREESDSFTVPIQAEDVPDSFDIEGVGSVELLTEILANFGTISILKSKSEYFDWFTESMYSSHHFEPRLPYHVSPRRDMPDIYDLNLILREHNKSWKYTISPNNIIMAKYLDQDEFKEIEHAKYDPIVNKWISIKTNNKLEQNVETECSFEHVNSIINNLSKQFEKVKLYIEKSSEFIV